jgi:CRP/FNR family transcriptional regulator, cyclic AMP receptor protein
MSSACQQAFLELCEGAPIEGFAAGELLMQKGEAGGFCYVILGGSVRVQLGSTETSTQRSVIRGEGEMIGELSLFQKTRSATVMALTACECARIPHAALLQLFTTQPALGLALLAATMSKARGL